MTKATGRRKKSSYTTMKLDSFKIFKSDQDAYLEAARREGISKSEFIRRGVLARVAKVLGGVQ